MKNGDTKIRIGELARILQTTTKTIRFYESKGLLVAPARSEAGYRLYGVDSVAAAREVIGLRRLGLTINELKALVDGDRATSRRQRLLATLDEKLRERELELGVLQGQRDDLAARYESLLMTPADRPADCVCDALLMPCACRVGPP